MHLLERKFKINEQQTKISTTQTKHAQFVRAFVFTDNSAGIFDSEEIVGTEKLEDIQRLSSSILPITTIKTNGSVNEDIETICREHGFYGVIHMLNG